MAGDRPRPRALSGPQNGLAGIGLEPNSPLARAIVARGGRLVEGSGFDASHLVIGPRVGDPTALIAQALAARSRVMIENPSAHLDHRADLSAALTLRFEPAAQAARAALRSGSIGLPFASTGEVIGSSGNGCEAMAVEMLDAMLYVTGLSVESATRVGANPCVISLLMTHGVVGDVSALAVDVPEAQSLATLTIRGSQGSLQANLAAPHVIAVGKRAERLRIGESGVARLLDAFCAGAPLPTLAGAAKLADFLK